MKKSISILLTLIMIIQFLPALHIKAEETSNYVTYEESFTSAEDVKTYQFNFDFTDTDAAAICLVKTGQTNIKMYISDEDGNQIGYLVTNASLPKRWFFIEKPAENVTNATYTVTLKADTYNKNDSSFRLMAGNKEDTEEMISGKNNAVYLETYTEEKTNIMYTYYTPNNYACWYRFTAPNYAETVVTLLTYDKNIRFRLYNADNVCSDYSDMNNILYDSAIDNNAYRTKFCLNYTQAQKARFKNLEAGKDYYLVVYSIAPTTEKTLNTNLISLTVGKPNMCGNHVTCFASDSIKGTKSYYSSSATITPSGLPKTAVVDTVTLKTVFGLANMTKIASWRAKSPTDTICNVSSSSSMSFGYQKDSLTNRSAVGKWYVSFKATAKASTYSMLPGIDIQYYYELGD